MNEILKEYHPDCRWITDETIIAVQKYDGTCCVVIDCKFYKRRQVKEGQSIPNDFIQVDQDKNTGKIFGWIPVSEKGKVDKPYREAWERLSDKSDGTYELIVPKVQGNPEKQDFHILQRHSDARIFQNVPITYNEIRKWLKDKDIEGLVFRHPDGRMAKIKKCDFGQKR